MRENEIGLTHWQKAVRSAGNGQCVEVASVQSMIAIRDSKNPAQPALLYTTGEWAAFIDGVKKGEFDHFTQAGVGQ